MSDSKQKEDIVVSNNVLILSKFLQEEYNGLDLSDGGEIEFFIEISKNIIEFLESN